MKDSVDIIFCRECKYADDFHHCHHVNFWNKEDDFCSRGERREMDNDHKESQSYRFQSLPPEFRVTRACQICGEGTKSIDFILCDKCREALRKMIYGGEENDSTDSDA